MDPTQQDWSFLSFPHQLEPPIQTNSVKNFDPSTIASDAANTRIVVHPRFPRLIDAFLQHKRDHGSPHETALYADMTWQAETARLIEKRPFVFMGPTDYTVLRDGHTTIPDATLQWDRNGTAAQSHNSHLHLPSYLSYDEIMLSSLLGVSSPSHFLNRGHRTNRGRPAAPATHEPRGIIVGLVGPRFERPDRMDATLILRPPATPPTQHPALTALLSDFLGARRRPGDPCDFDPDVYRARVRVSADVLLGEADARAADAGRPAYVYVVGLGLGVWRYTAAQAGWYVEAFGDALAALPAAHRVAVVEFAYLSDVGPAAREVAVACGRAKGIEVRFSERDPAEKFSGKDVGKLLVLSYAWDGNAFPGNEYWVGSLMGSGDPAAACMSTIAELHNPLINPAFTSRIHVVQSGEK
jgi:hypothetical protein